jgi:soluble lytic murein transglycosylase-like protein
MILFILIGLLSAGGIYYFSSTATSDKQGGNPVTQTLPDIAPNLQGGSYDRAYDNAFSDASEKWGVPFALLKAHAVRESALDPNASRQEPARSGRPPSASYGLMQILWWKSSDRFRKYGYSDDTIGDGSVLYEPETNCSIAAALIKDNLKTFGTLRDAINAYNTGVKESTREAPNSYVDNVLSIYSELVNMDVA